MWIAKLANGQILLPPVLPVVTVKQMLRSKQPLTIVKLVLLVKPVLVELVPLVADKKSCVDCEIGKWSDSTASNTICATSSSSGNGSIGPFFSNAVGARDLSCSDLLFSGNTCGTSSTSTGCTFGTISAGKGKAGTDGLCTDCVAGKQ